jgi:hypothetical protein
VVVGFAQGGHSNESAQSAVILHTVISSYTATALAVTPLCLTLGSIMRPYIPKITMAVGERIPGWTTSRNGSIPRRSCASMNGGPAKSHPDSMATSFVLVILLPAPLN